MVKKKAVAVVENHAVATVKSAYNGIALSSVGQAKLVEMHELMEYAAEQTAAARRISITDDESDLAGKNVLVNIRKARKAAEEMQKFFTSPLEAAKKVVIATFKGLGAEAAEQEDRLTREAGALYMAKVVIARQEEARIQAERQAAAEKARRMGRAVVAPVAVPVEKPERVAQVDNGTVGQGTEWKAMLDEPVNLEIVPRQYLKLDESRVRQAVASGVREIPGVPIREVPKLAVR